jgi:hypothetical protein
MFTGVLAWARSWRVPAAAELQAMTDEQVMAAGWAARRQAGRAAVLAELERRDGVEAARQRKLANLAKAQQRNAELRAEWELHVHNAWLRAEADCNGYLLSRAGKAAGVDPVKLWAMAWPRAERLASEELRAWWALHGRVTFGEWRRQSRQPQPEAVPA